MSAAAHMTRPPAANARVCFNCAAWRPWGTQKVTREGSAVVWDEPLGQCRLRAPSVNPEAFHSITAAWPTVEMEDWCLEFRSGAA